MQVVATIAQARAAAQAARRNGWRIGFVPTMGYLHEGHLRLVDLAREESDWATVSIFVNPTQFGPHEDLATYPRDLSRDLALLEARRADCVFTPSREEMYPREGLAAVEIRRITAGLCGARRPGHFRGVATVVTKLLHIVWPSCVVFGQKDIQQAIALRRMVEDLDFPCRVLIAPTVREPDGLAMSSRNTYLTPAERAAAPLLYRALCRGADLIRGGEGKAAAIREAAERVVAESPLLRIDYVAVADADLCEEQEVVPDRALLAAAVYVGRTRLIDNVLVGAEGLLARPA